MFIKFLLNILWIVPLHVLTSMQEIALGCRSIAINKISKSSRFSTTDTGYPKNTAWILDISPGISAWFWCQSDGCFPILRPVTGTNELPVIIAINGRIRLSRQQRNRPSTQWVDTACLYFLYNLSLYKGCLWASTIASFSVNSFKYLNQWFKILNFQMN